MSESLTPGEEWTMQTALDLTNAGFVVKLEPPYLMFPLVEKPESIEESVRLMKLRTTFPCNRRIYAEGMMFLPIFPKKVTTEDGHD